MYMNYVQRLLFLHSMVTEVMHLAINVYLDGGKPGTFAGFEIKERTRSACCGDFWLSPIAGGGGGEHWIFSDQGCYVGMEAEKDLVTSQVA